MMDLLATYIPKGQTLSSYTRVYLHHVLANAMKGRWVAYLSIVSMIYFPPKLRLSLDIPRFPNQKSIFY